MTENDRRDWIGPILSPYAGTGKALKLPGSALVGLVQDVLSRGHFFRVAAPGTSMRPFIRDGDVITLAPCQPQALTIGDVVAFCRPGTDQLVVHRLVRVTEEAFCTRGDGCLEADGAIAAESVVAVVRRVERDGRTVMLGLGPERVCIALLSRRGLLPMFVRAGVRAKAMIGGAHG